MLHSFSTDSTAQRYYIPGVFFQHTFQTPVFRFCQNVLEIAQTMVFTTFICNVMLCFCLSRCRRSTAFCLAKPIHWCNIRTGFLWTEKLEGDYSFQYLI